MKGELKAGGLALVIGLRVQTQNNGKAVTLVELLHPGQFFNNPITGQRTVYSIEDETPGWLVTGDIVSASGGFGWSIFDRKNLLPIDGEDDQEPDQLTKDKPAELTA